MMHLISSAILLASAARCATLPLHRRTISPDFNVTMQAFAGDACSDPVNATQTLTLDCGPGNSFDFNVRTAIITIPDEFREQAQELDFGVWFSPGCSTPNRQGYYYTKLPETADCQSYLTDDGGAQSFNLVQLGD